MILLIIEEQPEGVSAVLEILKKGGGSHEVHTASSFATARSAARRMAELDVLITTVATSEGALAHELCDDLRRRFPELQVAFLVAGERAFPDAADEGDPAFSNPPDEEALLAWARKIGLAKSEPISGESRLLAPPVQVEDDLEEEEDELPVAETLTAPGKRLGDYELVRLIGGDGETETHEATQLSIGRRVALVLLRPEFAEKHESVREFRGRVRARANVSHPNIAPVYEGFEEAGSLFYTRELIEGKNLPVLADEGTRIDNRAMVGMVRVIAEALGYMEANGLNHHPLRTRHIYLGADRHTRIANIAVLEAEDTETAEQHIRYLGAKLQPLLAPGGTGVGEHLLAKMRDAAGPSTWEGLLEAVAAAEKDISEATTYKVETSIAKRRTAARRWIAVSAVAVIAACGIFFAALPKVAPPKPRELDAMVRVSGGEFVYRDGKTRTLPTFWIDRTEVTIAEYAEFLEALGLPHSTQYDHPDQPPEKLGHQPDGWDEYFEAASRGARYDDKPIDLNCPVVFVDWWDAYAYAKWRGRRLPTEEEWERAGRGKDGKPYPWGNDPSAVKLASTEPGYVAWRPVDSVPGDTSEAGVLCLAGNVREWTGTWESHPEIVGREVPVLRGGSWRDPGDAIPDLTVRRTVDDPSDRADDLGFRTVSDTDPSPKEP